MNAHNYFSLKRFIGVLKMDMSRYITAGLIGFVILIILSLLFPIRDNITSIGAFYLILYIGGIIFTGKAFHDIHNANTSQPYLMLPCSNLERFLSRWLLTSIIFSLLTLLFYFLSTMLATLVENTLLGFNVHPLNLSNPKIWYTIEQYMILQPLFLLGAIFFKRYNVAKTLLMFSLFVGILIAFTVIFSLVICQTCDYTFSLISIFDKSFYLFWIALAPVCLYLTYLRITESEI